MAARPAFLVASLAPVLVGTTAGARGSGEMDWLAAALAALAGARAQRRNRKGAGDPGVCVGSATDEARSLPLHPPYMPQPQVLAKPPARPPYGRGPTPASRRGPAASVATNSRQCSKSSPP